MDLPNIEKYNQELNAKRIKWVEEKMRNPFWKSSLKHRYNPDLSTAKNLHLKLYPIELFRSEVFNSNFINQYHLNTTPLESSKYYKSAKAYKELISLYELSPDLQKKAKKGYQLFINSFKFKVDPFDLSPSLLNYLDLSLDDIIFFRAENYSLDATLRELFRYKWFKEFIKFISLDGATIESGVHYNYYQDEIQRLKKEKLNIELLRKISAIENILDIDNFAYAKYIVAEHYKFFNNVCAAIIRRESFGYSSKSQKKLVISNFTKLYKLIYKEEKEEYQRKMNIKKTGERRGKSTRSVDTYAKIQHLKEQGYKKTQIQSETGFSLPTIRKYWNCINNSQDDL